MIEYWDLENELPACVTFKSKFQTDLFDFFKNSITLICLEISPDGKRFATLGNDFKLRLYDFCSGKILFMMDESIGFYEAEQMKEDSIYKIEPFQFGLRVATEKEALKEISNNPYIYNDMLVWDCSSNFVIYPTLVGIKVVNVVSENVVRIIGTGESNMRFLNVSLFQGIPTEVGESAHARLNAYRQFETCAKQIQEDPSLFCTAFQSARFHIFTQREPIDLDE
eukprot:UN30668